MRTIAYSIIGLFFLSLLLVATSFADEGSVCHNGLQPYVDTSSEDTSQSLENGHVYQRDYGYSGTSWDMAQFIGLNYYRNNGLQPYVDTSSEDTSQSPENEHIYQREYGLQPCWGTSPNMTWGGR